MPETKCPHCGAAVYHDKPTWCKCETCGKRVYFDSKYRKLYGNPLSPKFRRDPWNRDPVDEDKDEEDNGDDAGQSSLDDY